MNASNSFPTSTCRSRMQRVVAAALIASAPVLARAADDAPVSAITAFSSAPQGEPPAAWKFATLPNKAPTRFVVMELSGARVLKVDSDASYGNLVHALHTPSSDKTTLAWRWRVDKLVEEADLKTKAGEDSAAKMCVFFAFDAAKLSFGERTKLSVAQSVSGQEVPTETLCYVWDNKLPADTGLVSPFTKRIRFIVLESGTAHLGQWVAQKRNLGADYQRMFGDESGGKYPDITGVAVAADADNTRGHGLAYFGDITLAP